MSSSTASTITTLTGFNLDAQGATTVLIFSSRRDIFSLLTTSKTTSKIFDTASVWQSYCYHQGITLCRNDLKLATRNDWKEFAMHLPRFQMLGNIGKDGRAWHAVGKKSTYLEELRRLVARLAKVSRYNFRNGIHIPSLDNDLVYLIPLDYYKTNVKDWYGFAHLGQSGVFTTMRNKITVSPGRCLVLDVELQCCTEEHDNSSSSSSDNTSSFNSFDSDTHFREHDPRCHDPSPE